jgi:hypothetical protein
MQGTQISRKEIARMCRGRVIFKNPNVPEQPANGVYRWYYVKDGKGKTFYVGQAGGRKGSLVRRPSTLARGVSELHKACFSSDKGRSLDTDFIVGTAIEYLGEHGFDCVWEHICDDPDKEKNLCGEHKPILQDGNKNIRKKFKLAKSNGTPWNGRNKHDVTEAKQELGKPFAEVFEA